VVIEFAFADDEEIVGEREETRNNPGTMSWVVGHWKAFEVVDANDLCGESEDNLENSSGSVMLTYFVAGTVCLDFVALVVGILTSSIATF
jgi:hypothetical protein